MTGKVRLTRIAVALLSLAALLAYRSPRAAEIQERGGAIPTLRLSIRALHPDAPGGVEASPSWQLSRDTVAAPTVTAGSADYADLCAVGAGGKSFQPGTRVGWQVEGRLLDVDASGARVWIRWTRRVLDSRVVDAGDLVREYEARLTDGDRIVLDLVRPPAGTNPECDGVVVQMGLEFSEAPDLANAVLDYDVWLVHREADGREVLDRMSGRGLQGHSVDYLFKRLRYDASGFPNPDGPVDVELRGSVRGRVRPDGQIDLAVGATRTVLKSRLGNGRGGSKQATIGDGETIELEMPSYDLKGSGFDTQRTAIRVTVRRLS
jgi:hypothetical protein